MTIYDFYSLLCLLGIVAFVYLDKWVTHKLNKTDGW